MTTTPVAALPIPGEQNQAHHLLYTLSNQAQLGFEIRPAGQGGYDQFQNNQAPEGPIKNPASFAGIIQQSVPVVYGIIKLGTSEQPKDVISRLSPYLNPLADHSGNLFSTDHKAVSACADEHRQKYYVHFFQKNQASQYQLIELEVNGDKASKVPYRSVLPSKESNLASLAYEDRWIFWVDEGYVRYISTNQSQGVTKIKSTIGVKGDSPLAVSTYRSHDKNKFPVLRVALYHVNEEKTLTRTKGVIRDSQLDIEGTKALDSFDNVNNSSLLSLVSQGDINYLYYQPGDSTEYSAIVDEWIADSATPSA